MIQVGWFGIGFGNNMIGSDMITFQIKTVQDLKYDTIYYKHIQVTDMYSFSNEPPWPDSLLGGEDNVELLGYDFGSFETGKIKIKFRRKMDTQDSYDHVFQKILTNFTYAFDKTESTLTGHSTNRGKFRLDLQQENKSDEIDNYNTRILQMHVVFLLGGWGVLSDFSIIIVRYFKGYGKYLRVHGIIFVVLNIVTILTVGVMIDMNSQKIKKLEQQPQSIQAHFVIGCFTLSIIIIQHLLGLVVKINLESEQGHESILKIKKIHRWLGFTVYIASKVQVYLGAVIYTMFYDRKLTGTYMEDDDNRIITYLSLYYTFLVIIFIIFQIFYSCEPAFMGKKIHRKYVDI